MGNNPVNMVDPDGGFAGVPGGASFWIDIVSWLTPDSDGNVYVTGTETWVNPDGGATYMRTTTVSWNVKDVTPIDLPAKALPNVSAQYEPWMFSARPEEALGRGALTGMKSTGKFLQSLGTQQGWKDLGMGMVNMAHMTSSTSSYGATLRDQTTQAASNYIDGLQYKTSQMILHDVGYGVQKVGEGVLFKRVSSVNPFGFRSGYGVFGKNGLKIGNYKIEALYANSAAGPRAGTLFSTKQMKPGGALWRWDYGKLHSTGNMGLHSTVRFHWKGVKYGSTTQRTWYPSSFKAPFFKPIN